MMLVLHNVKMVSSNVRKKKIKKLLNVTKVQLHVMLVLRNVRMVPSNVRKNKGITECDKSIIICNVSTTQYMWGWYHQMWEKKIKEPLNVTKVQSHVMLVLHNVRMVPLNVRKNKRIIECDKSTITYDVSTTQCEDGTIKCDVLVTWYSKLSTSGYHTPKKKGYYKITHIKILYCRWKCWRNWPTWATICKYEYLQS